MFSTKLIPFLVIGIAMASAFETYPFSILNQETYPPFRLDAEEAKEILKRSLENLASRHGPSYSVVLVLEMYHPEAYRPSYKFKAILENDRGQKNCDVEVLYYWKRIHGDTFVKNLICENKYELFLSFIN